MSEDTDKSIINFAPKRKKSMTVNDIYRLLGQLFTGSAQLKQEPAEIQENRSLILEIAITVSRTDSGELVTAFGVPYLEYTE